MNLNDIRIKKPDGTFNGFILQVWVEPETPSCSNYVKGARYTLSFTLLDSVITQLPTMAEGKMLLSQTLSIDKSRSTLQLVKRRPRPFCETNVDNPFSDEKWSKPIKMFDTKEQVGVTKRTHTISFQCPEMDEKMQSDSGVYARLTLCLNCKDHAVMLSGQVMEGTGFGAEIKNYAGEAASAA